MADWSVIKPALKGWVEAVTGLTAFWIRLPRSPKFGNQGYILMDIAGRRGVGRDWISSVYDSGEAAGSQMRQHQEGQRQFTLAVQVRTRRASVDLDSRHYTSLLRDSTSLPITSTAVFAAADVAFARVMADVNPGEYILDGRTSDVSEIQLRFNATSQIEDTATTWVETANATSVEVPEDTVVGTVDLEVG